MDNTVVIAVSVVAVCITVIVIVIAVMFYCYKLKTNRYMPGTPSVALLETYNSNFYPVVCHRKAVFLTYLYFEIVFLYGM